jgi:hypothetical protein
MGWIERCHSLRERVLIDFQYGFIEKYSERFSGYRWELELVLMREMIHVSRLTMDFSTRPIN